MVVSVFHGTHRNLFVFLVLKTTPSKIQRPGVKSHLSKGISGGTEVMKPSSALSDLREAQVLGADAPSTSWSLIQLADDTSWDCQAKVPSGSNLGGSCSVWLQGAPGFGPFAIEQGRGF